MIKSITETGEWQQVNHYTVEFLEAIVWNLENSACYEYQIVNLDTGSILAQSDVEYGNPVSALRDALNHAFDIVEQV